MGVVLFELVGKLGADTFKHKGPIVLNVGVSGASTVILKLAVVAH